MHAIDDDHHLMTAGEIAVIFPSADAAWDWLAMWTIVAVAPERFLRESDPRHHVALVATGD